MLPRDFFCNCENEIDAPKLTTTLKEDQYVEAIMASMWLA